MQVPEGVLSHTGFIGAPQGTGTFRADATGFFVNVAEEEFDFGYFITAKHAIWGDFRKRDAQPPTGSIYLRVNKQNGGPHIIETNAADWCFHTDRAVDLCAYPFDIQRYDPDDSLDISLMNLCPSRVMPNIPNSRPGGMALRHELFLGDEVFIIGTFVGRVGEKRNIPIVRVANIAALPTEPVSHGSPRHPAYLIETRSLGGTSGSPVFCSTARGPFGNSPSIRGPFRPQQIGRQDTPGEHSVGTFALVGMVLGAHQGTYADDFVSEEDTDFVGPFADAEFNAGISVVLPVGQIEAFLESPEMKASRDSTTKERQKQSGYFPTSASGNARTSVEPERPAIQGDEQHKERFSSLLDEALRKPKQGG